MGSLVDMMPRSERSVADILAPTAMRCKEADPSQFETLVLRPKSQANRITLSPFRNRILF
jgi:hypothetical protein